MVRTVEHSKNITSGSRVTWQNVSVGEKNVEIKTLEKIERFKNPVVSFNLLS